MAATSESSASEAKRSEWSRFAEASFIESNEPAADAELRANLHELWTVNSEESLKRALDSIEPTLQQLNPDQFGLVFDLFGDLISHLKWNRIMDADKSVRILRGSTGFVSLLSRSNSNLRELDPAGLTALFRLLMRISHNPQSVIVQNTVHCLISRLDELNLEQLSANLFRLQFYGDRFSTDQLIPAKACLLEHCRKRILNSNELDPENVNQLAQLFYNFLMSYESSRNSEMVERLAGTLLSPELKLSFKESVQTLKKICLVGRSRRGKKDDFPPVLADLIGRCNGIVYETLKSDPDSSENHYRLLEGVHNKRNKLNSFFQNMYEPRLLDLLAAFLVKRHSDDKYIGPPHEAYQILNLVYHYSRFSIYHEQLTELLHRLVCSGVYPKDDFAFPEYQLLTSHRWPFLDQSRLLEVLKSSRKLFDIRQSGTTYYGLLCQLILNEINDPELLHCLIERARKNRPSIHQMQTKKLILLDYKQTTLVRLLVSTLGQSDKHLESELRRTFDQRLNLISQSPHWPQVGSSAGKTAGIVNGKLKKGCFLSNGVFVDAFAIYDRSVGDLISLERFREHFEAVDLIPLSGDQER